MSFCGALELYSIRVKIQSAPSYKVMEKTSVVGDITVTYTRKCIEVQRRHRHTPILFQTYICTLRCVRDSDHQFWASWSKKDIAWGHCHLAPYCIWSTICCFPSCTPAYHQPKYSQWKKWKRGRRRATTWSNTWFFRKEWSERGRRRFEKYDVFSHLVPVGLWWDEIKHHDIIIYQYFLPVDSMWLKYI